MRCNFTPPFTTQSANAQNISGMHNTRKHATGLMRTLLLGVVILFAQYAHSQYVGTPSFCGGANPICTTSGQTATLCSNFNPNNGDIVNSVYYLWQYSADGYNWTTAPGGNTGVNYVAAQAGYYRYTTTVYYTHQYSTVNYYSCNCQYDSWSGTYYNCQTCSNVTYSYYNYSNYYTSSSYYVGSVSPAVSGIISNAGNSVCVPTGQYTDVIYTVSGGNFNSLSWSVPAWMTILNGQGSSQLAVRIYQSQIGAGASGSVSATPILYSCAGNPASISVAAAATPANGATIFGQTQICDYSALYTYSVQNYGTANSFHWNVGGNASIVSQSNNSVVISFAPGSASTSISCQLANTSGLGSCTANSQALVVNFNPLPVVISSVTNTTCSGANGSITLSATGGNAPFQYSINGRAPFQTGNVFSGLTPGNYYAVVKSASGCVSAVQPVTVANTPDVTAPVPDAATLPDVTGECAATVTTVPTATDNCAGTINGTTTDPLSYNTQGRYTITWSFNDGNGNTTAQTQNVIVKDITPPVITSQPAITTPTNPDGSVTATSVSGAVVMYSAPAATDNCSGNVTVTSVPASGSVFPIGTTAVNYVATDAAGLTTSGTFNITVSGIAPVITSPGNISVSSAPGQCGANVSFAATETTGNPASTITYSINPGSFFPVGTTAVTATATNAVGSSSCTFNVTVTDNENPVFAFTIPPVTGTKTVNIPYLQTQVSSWSPVTFNFADPLPAGAVITGIDLSYSGKDQGWGGTGDYNHLYVSGTQIGGNQYLHYTQSYNLTYTGGIPGYVYGGNNTFQMYFTGYPGWQGFFYGGPMTIHYQIPSPPPPSNVTVKTDPGVCGAVVTLTAPAAKDNCGIQSVTSDAPAVFPVGTTTVTWTATDIHNNTSTVTQTVTVTDNEKPVITTNGNQSVNNDAGKCGATVTVSASATDNCGVGAPTGVRSDGLALTDLYPVGSTTITWNVTDRNGNAAVAVTQTVTVTDNEKPVITTNGNQSANNDAGKCGATVSVSASATDNCGVGTPAGVRSDGLALTDLYPVGTTTVTWTVTDIHGNSNTATQTVTVTDNEKPSVTAPAAISVNNDAGICGAVVALGTPTTGDNCGVATTTNNAPATFPVGTTTVTWTVTDIHGNSNTATQTVTVTDNEKPTITAPATVSVSNDAGKCSAVVTLGTATTGDNCGVASTTSDAPAIFPVGTTTVTWTVIDIHGNSNTATQTVTVTDNEKPVIACGANQVFCANFGGVTTYSIPVLSASDNCGIASTTYTVSGATNRSGSGNDASGVFAVGVSTVTYTVTDIHNNVSTCSFTVTINPLPVATITASTADAFCNKLTLTGSSTLSGPFSYQWLYANSTFSTSNPVDLGLTNGDGVYSLYTTDANGCRSEFAATYNYQKQNLSSSYTIIAYKEAELGDYNTVASGSVGVLSAKGEAEFGRYSTVTSPGSFVKAVKIELEKYASVSQPIRAAATPVLPTMIYNTANTRSLPNYEVKGGTTVTLNGNYGNLNIKKGSVVTLTGTVFGTIHTEEGAQLTFTKSSISIDKLQLDKGPKTGYTYVHFAPNSQVLVSRSVSIGDRIFLNPENNKVTFYVGTLQDNKKGDNDRDDEARFNVNGKDVKVTVNVMMPNGKLKANGGDMGDDDSKKSATSYVYMTGLFVAAEVEGEGKHVIWNSFDCSAPASSAVNASAFVSQSVSTKEETTVTTEEELKITVMPNPSTTHFTLKLESRYETPVNMRVMDASGRVIDSRSRIGSNSTIQIGHNYSSGTYYAELMQGTRRKVVQLIKVKD